MSGLREEIRAILREELRTLRAEISQPESHREAVRIASSSDLNRFAQDLAERCADPDFSDRIMRGEITFELAAPPVIGGMIVSGPVGQPPTVLDKPLITERDIAELKPGRGSLRVGPHSRLTPLARDEARARGIRIERTET